MVARESYDTQKNIGSSWGKKIDIYVNLVYNKKQLQDLVDKYASKFSRLGIEKGDKIYIITYTVANQ